jgi:hypothetical protein
MVFRVHLAAFRHCCLSGINPIQRRVSHSFEPLSIIICDQASFTEIFVDVVDAAGILGMYVLTLDGLDFSMVPHSFIVAQTSGKFG